MNEPTSKRVVFDTNALFHVPVRTMIEHLSQARAFEPLWSARTVKELRGVLAARGRAGADGFFAQFPHSAIMHQADPREDARLRGFRDPGDLHVVQAAISAGAAQIVTDNARDFPSRLLSALGVARWGVDAFFANELSALPVTNRGPNCGPEGLRRAGLTRTARQLVRTNEAHTRTWSQT